MSGRFCPECGWSGAHLSTCSLLPSPRPRVLIPLRDALDRRHGDTGGRLMEPEGPGHRGYVSGDGPE